MYNVYIYIIKKGFFDGNTQAEQAKMEDIFNKSNIGNNLFLKYFFKHANRYFCVINVGVIRFCWSVTFIF